MPRRTLNTKAATTWRKDASHIYYQMMQEIVHTALVRGKPEGMSYHDYQQKSGSYLPAEKANTTAETRRKIPAQVDLERICVKCFFHRREDNSTQNSLHKISFAESYTAIREENSQPPPKIRNGGSEEVVTNPKITQRRNHVGRHYPRKCKPQRAENPTVRDSRNGMEIPRENLEGRITDEDASKFDRPEASRN